MKPPRLNMETMNNFINMLPHRWINVLGYSSSALMTVLGALEKYNGVFGALIFLGISIYFKWRKGIMDSRKAEQEIMHKQQLHEQQMKNIQEIHKQNLENLSKQKPEST